MKRSSRGVTQWALTAARPGVSREVATRPCGLVRSAEGTAEAGEPLLLFPARHLSAFRAGAFPALSAMLRALCGFPFVLSRAEHHGFQSGFRSSTHLDRGASHFPGEAEVRGRKEAAVGVAADTRGVYGQAADGRSAFESSAELEPLSSGASSYPSLS